MILVDEAKYTLIPLQFLQDISKVGMHTAYTRAKTRFDPWMSYHVAVRTEAHKWP